MRRPRKPVPPNTVTVRSFVATMIQIRQLMWDRTAVRMRWAARRLLLFLCWCARKHGRHTFRIDVEGQEYQRLVAWVSPLVHEGVRFIDQGTRSLCFCLTVDRVGPGAGDDKVESGTRPMVRRVGGHLRRKGDSREIEIVTTWLQVGDRIRGAIQFCHDSGPRLDGPTQVHGGSEEEVKESRRPSVTCR